MKRRCPQCWKLRAPVDFTGRRGLPVKRCITCQRRYGRRWARLTLTQRAALTRTGIPNTGTLLARLAPRSGNRKLGGIPSSMTSRTTCPTSCAFYKSGCYAEYHVTAHHWRKVGLAGDSWSAFCAGVRALDPGQLWRHNVAGDLPGEDEYIDEARLGELVLANRGRRGFTFTHKATGRGHFSNRAAIRRANEQGFTVNLSADSLEHADALARLKIAPVAVVLPADERRTHLRTPEGRMVTVCPAETAAALTCATCELCSLASRKSIIGFVAHGQSKALVSEIVRRKRAA